MQALAQGARFGPTAPTDAAGSGRAKKTGLLADKANRESLRALAPLRKKNAATAHPRPRRRIPREPCGLGPQPRPDVSLPAAQPRVASTARITRSVFPPHTFPKSASLQPRANSARVMFG
jgi:hypothetical protein